MVNNIGTSFNKKFNKRALPITLAALLSLQGCGGGGGSNTEEGVIGNQINSSPVLKDTLTGFIKAGPIVGANVSLKTLDGHILVTVTTDNKGMYSFDTAYLLRQLSNNGLTKTSPLLLESENGIDIDPDDDGNIYNTVQKQVLGKVKAVLDLQNLDGILANPISTLVVDTILGEGGKNTYLYKKSDGSFDSEKIQEKIQQLVKELGIGDINKDGKIDGKDALSYDMQINQSKLRDDMLSKGGYIETNIHDGKNTITLQSNYLQKVNFVNVYSKSLSVSHGEITLGSSDAGGYMSYSNDGKSWLNYISPITIYAGQKVYYKETYSDNKGTSIVKQIDFSDLPIWNNTSTGNTNTGIQTPNIGNTTSNTEVGNSNTGNITPNSGVNTTEVTQESNLVLDNSLKTISYTPIKLSSIKSIETLKTELDGYEKQITTIKATQTSVETQKKSAEVQIVSLSNTLSTQVNSLPPPIKILANADSSESQKNNAVTTYLGTSVNSSVSNTNIQVVNPVRISNSSVEVTRLSSKISQFQTELNLLESQKNTAYTIYQKKYQEYLDAKKIYDQSKADAIYWKNQYDLLKTQVTNKEIEYRGASTNEDNAIINYSNYILPNASNYSISTSTASTYIQAKIVPQLTFTHRGYAVSGTFNVQSNGKFPGTLKVIIQGNSANYTINSTTHLSAFLNVLPQKVKVGLDKTYYHNEVIRIGSELSFLRQKKDEAYTKAYTEIMDAYADKSIYESAKGQYDTSLANYNIANTNFVAKKSNANNASNQLIAVGNTNTNLVEQTNTKAKLIEETVTLGNEKNRLIVLSGQTQKTIETVNLEIGNKVTESLGKIILKNWNPGILSLSTNLELYPNSTMEFKNGYTGGVFKNRNDILVQTNETVVNQSEYNNFPFTLKVKYNRVNNGNDFPALIWGEYKESPNSNIIYSTERYIANNQNDIASIFVKLTPLIKERINLMQHGYGDNIKDTILTGGDSSESIHYISTLSHNKVVDYLTNVQRSSTQYLSGFGAGGLRATQDSVDMLKSGAIGTVTGLKTYGDTLIDSIVFWEAKIAYSITGDPIYQSVQRTVSNNLINQSVKVIDEMNTLDDELKKMKDDIVKAIGLINTSVENPEYWGGYINGYLSVLITGSATITVASKNAGFAINTLKSSNGYKKIQQLISKVNVAGEIYKSTFKRVDLEKLTHIMDPLEEVLGGRGKIIFPRLITLAQKYNINEKTFVHLVEGEWNDNGTLKGGLHYMKEIEELLKDGKVKVATYKNGNWTERTKDEFISLDNTSEEKLNPKIKGMNDNKKWSNIGKKTLFPSNWTEEDIAILIQKAEDNIRTILLDEYHLPLKGEHNKFWKFQAIKDDLIKEGEDIAQTFTVNGKTLIVKLGGQYNSNGDLDFTITTLYP